jgi:hypothetical protein
MCPTRRQTQVEKEDGTFREQQGANVEDLRSDACLEDVSWTIPANRLPPSTVVGVGSLLRITQ